MLSVHANPMETLPPALAGGPGMHFASSDRDEVRSYVGRMFCEHSLDLANRRARLDTRISHLRCATVSLTEMGYGAEVLIDAGRLENFYLIQLPVAGRAALTLGGRHGEYVPGRGSVQDPERPLQMHWSEDCRKLVARFDRAAFERFAEACLGRPLRNCLQFAPSFEAGSAQGQQLVGQLLAAVDWARRAAEAPPSPLVERHLETALMAALLFLQPHALSEALAEPGKGAPPTAVRRVQDFLEAHAHEPVDMVQLADVAGVPLRTLYHQFRQALGVSPMQLLRDIRLERARGELLAPGPATSVTQVALDWGFDHLGRFAIAYRRRFGETPRDTLRRRRGLAQGG